MMDGGGGYVDKEEEEEEEEDSYHRKPTTFHHDDGFCQRDSSFGKLFVGGIAWETTRERFTDYFCKYGEVTDAIIMMDKYTGKPRGFGFVTFADPTVADKVLQEDHVMDGRTIEVKRTVPREAIPVRGDVPRTRKLFVGGLVPKFTEDELKEYFSSFGHVVEHQIMFDHETGRSRSFGFVTFENEETVERILSDDRVHELGGRPVEIKRALPKRFGGDYANEHCGGGVSKPYGGYKGGANEYQGGYSGKMGRGYDDYGNYGAYMGNYGGGAASFYGGYGGYGSYGYGGFWGPMYGTGVYGGNMYGGYSGGSGGGGGAGYGAGGGGGFSGSKGYSGGGKGYGASSSTTGRYHPYQK